VNAPNTTYTDSSVSNGTRYFYKIVAVYTDKESPASVEAPALPLDPTSTAQDTNNLFVSPSGTDGSGNGSIGNPYLTIMQAQSILTANGTIFLKDGYYTAAIPTFSKSLTLQSMTGDYRTSAAVISQSGTQTPGTNLSVSYSANNVVFRGIEGVNVILQSLSSARSGIGFYNSYFHALNSTWLYTHSAALTNWTLHGNYIKDIGNRATNTYAIVTYWAYDSPVSNTNWMVTHNTFENPSWAGFQFDAVSGITFKHNTFSSTCDNAVQFHGSNPAGTVDVAYNTFNNSYQAGGNAGCRASGIGISGAASYSPSFELNIHDNIFTQNGAAIDVHQTYAACDLTNKKISITNNTFSTNNTAGVKLSCSAGTLDVRNNYWGDSSGPTYSENAGGVGAVFTIDLGSILFSPFLTTAP
jgi:hypothetical protein